MKTGAERTPENHNFVCTEAAANLSLEFTNNPSLNLIHSVDLFFKWDPQNKSTVSSVSLAEFTLETSNPSWTGFSSETSFPS